MKTCLFGGSFDPVHAGHIAISTAAQRECGVDRVVFLPTACSPFKKENTLLFSDEERLAMLYAATEELAWAEVSALDLQMPPPSWSWRVVEAWQAEHPNDELYWLLGTDQWELLHLWARPDYLAEHLTFIVYHRDREPMPRAGVRSVFLPGAYHPVSASAIRAALMSHEALPDGWLPAGVEKLAKDILKSR